MITNLVGPLVTGLSSHLVAGQSASGIKFDNKNGRYLNDGQLISISEALTEGRSTDAYVLDGYGNYVLRGPNEPAQAFGHGLDGFDTIFNQDQSTDLVSAVVGTPGTLPTGWRTDANGLTTDVSGLGTENGLPFIDVHISGTITSSFYNVVFRPSIGASAGIGEDWYNRFDIKLMSGSIPGNTNAVIFERNAAGGFLASRSLPITPISSYITVDQMETLLNASTANVDNAFSFSSVTIGTVVDFTIRLRAIHLTKDNPARAIVLTGTGTEGTRGADDTRVVQGDDGGSPTIAPGITANPNELTFLVAWDGVAVGGGTRYPFEIDNASNRRVTIFLLSGGDLLFGGDQTGSFQAVNAGGGFDDGGPHSVICYVNRTTSEFKIAVDGGATISSILTGAVPPNLNQAFINRRQTAAADNLNGINCQIYVAEGDHFDEFKAGV